MWKIVAFIAFDVIAVIAVAAITYRWLFKRVLDIVCSGVCILLLSPLYLAFSIRNKKSEKGLVKEKYIGKKGKTVYLLNDSVRSPRSTFSIYSFLDIFTGKLSFIGVTPFRPSDAEFLDEEEKDRHIAKPGLINPLVTVGNEETTYDDMIENDVNYALNFSLGKDCVIFFSWLLKKIRAEGKYYLGETVKSGYAQSLLEEERITKEDYEAALALDGEKE